MQLDEALKEAFGRELDAVPERLPGAGEAYEACRRFSEGRARERGLGLRDLVPALALAAAAAVALCVGPESLGYLRPLARELDASLPAGAGSRFADFVLETGESYRSF